MKYQISIVLFFGDFLIVHKNFLDFVEMKEKGLKKRQSKSKI